MEFAEVSSHITADGSSTLCSKRFGAHYHSLNGALTESQHIFIDAGIKLVNKKNISILEVGFGTGLNAALTASYAVKNEKIIDYLALELFPLSESDFKALNYDQILQPSATIFWKSICEADWDKKSEIVKNFIITKKNEDFTAWQPATMFNLVYFDAFAPNDQPEMWEEKQFKKIFDAMHQNGILVTYCVKGVVKKALVEAGFTIERLPGPPGKRHMLRAWKK